MLATAGSQIFGGLIGLVIWLLVMIWIYNLAKRKGRHAVLWLVLGFFFSLLTLIVLLILPSKLTTERRANRG